MTKGSPINRMKKKYLGGVLLLNSLLGRTIAPEEVKAIKDVDESVQQVNEASSGEKSPDGSWLLTTLDGHSLGYDISKNVFVVDLSSQVKVNYLGTNTGEMAYRILTSDSTEELEIGEYVDGDIIDLSAYSDGLYYAEISKKKSQGSQLNPDTIYVLMNKESLLVSIEIGGPHGTINPEKVTYLVEPEISELQWTIKDEEGNLVLDGDGSTIEDGILTTFSGNTYLIKAIVKAQSKYGNQLKNQSESRFMIRHPESDIKMDQAYNPASIIGIKNIAESRLEWEVSETSGRLIESGEGEILSEEFLRLLSENTYEISFTETSPENETHMSKKVFNIRFPESTTTIDRPFNPRIIIGEKKILESTLEWVIKDFSGTIIESGSGPEVPQQILLNLLQGEYTIYFTETSPEGDTHTSNGTFNIRHPESTIAIDRPYNPRHIIGEKSIPESLLEWMITDMGGTKVAWGHEQSISEDILMNLPEGTYLVDFTEISPEEEIHTSHGSFTIRYPEATLTMDRSYNPRSILGGKKLLTSSLTWVIRDESGSVIELGSGDEIPQDLIRNLPESIYVAGFKETSPEEETHTVWEEFIVRYPESSTMINRVYNPTVVTGGKKISESRLEWVIKGETDEIVDSGEGSQIPYEQIAHLEEGNYIVEYTEISPEDETHTSNGRFIIRYPESVTTIDRVYNPKSVIGKKKIPDSRLEWAIRDEEGTVIESNEGNKIPQRIIVRLPEGDYLAEFTEKSLEDKIHVSNGRFTIVRLVDPEESEESEKKALPTKHDPEDDQSTLIVYYQEVRILSTGEGSPK